MNTQANVKSPVQCGGYRDCRDPLVSWLFFIIGLVATFAIRVVTVLMHLDAGYGKLAWYTGVIGFFFFFMYKFKVAHTRARRIQESGLDKKIAEHESLTCEDYALIKSILCGIGSRKERINFFFIFFLSAVALSLAVYMDFLR